MLQVQIVKNYCWLLMEIIYSPILSCYPCKDRFAANAMRIPCRIIASAMFDRIQW